jgi:hypothetical protein
MKSFKELINEAAFKLNTKVKIVGGPKHLKDIEGHIGEIRHGAYKGAPKTYTVYHGENGAVQLPAEHIRTVKEA